MKMEDQTSRVLNEEEVAAVDMLEVRRWSSWLCGRSEQESEGPLCTIPTTAASSETPGLIANR
jgi:hypothetical protein